MSQKPSNMQSVAGAIVLLLIIGSLYFFMNNQEDNTKEQADIKEETISVVVPETKEQVVEDVKKETNSIVVLDTNKGVIKIELFEDKMPITTGNFKKLIDEGFYDGIKFHRVIDNFMVQVGDPQTKDDSKEPLWGTGGPGYTIEDEFVAGLSNIKGTISMANTGQPNSGGSQIFINTVDNTNLDFDKPPFTSKHPVFGAVIEGMDIVLSIKKGDVISKAHSE